MGWIDGLAHWRDDETCTANISIAFTWKIDEARKLAEYYKGLGYHVRAGGPAMFRMDWAMKDVAEVNGIGAIVDAVFQHNPDATTASRGCPVGCWFCIVPAMEGKDFTLLPEFTPRPILTDNNLSALPADYQQYIVDRYIGFGVPLMDANSGFEPKTFDEEVFERWRLINRGSWRFALDETQETDDVRRVIGMLKQRGVGARKIQVYVMIGHEPFEQCMDRIRTVIDLGGEPYVQPVMKLNAREKKPWIRDGWTPELLSRVTRWINGRKWKYCSLEEYDVNARSPRKGQPGGFL